ncbi:TonB-dependent receptor [Novosphingobium sp. Gsoil 351]|uniref:TonB-dependent receptor n=1 Tax=Novosphingobium sp. Gsoil 351 TaxID=2675225 RepID=UPI001E5CC50B|nr:TonB-dependent receptor [Novosphingobium sp. Gsoil 351]
MFGKNTTGGVVNVVTKGPDLDRFGGYAKFTYGSFERTEAELVANLPLVEDKIGVRVGTALTHRDGFGRGGAGLALTGRELADDDEIFVRGSLLFRPGEALSVRVNADYHTVDESTSIFRSLRSALGGFIALKSINPDIYVGNDFRADRPFVRSNEFNLNGTIEVDLGAATLSSITSYRTQDSLTLVQSAPSTAVLLGQQSDLYAQELRLAGIAVDGRLKWQVGAFYSDESGVDIDVLKGFSLDTTTAASNKGWSVFTQDSFALTDTLTLTGGVRYTHEKRRVRSLVFTQANKASFDGVSWLVGLDFKPNSDTLLYANVSRGFRSGAIDQDNIATIVQPEFVLNYEVGLKAELFDRRVRFNSAAFYSDYTDIQRTSFDPNSPVPVTVLRNAAQATIWGFEGELNAVPVAGLTLGATVGYTNAKFDKFLDDNGQGVVIDRSDDPIGGPRWQLSASGRYEFDISSVAKAGLQANYFWIGKAILAGPSVAAVLAPGEAILNSYGLLNAQIDLDIADLGGNLGGLNIALFGTNILDKEYYAGGIALALFGGVSNRIVGEPRQWGIRITKEF